ncbi:PREDICTED: probable LRR receptor-like serine/threonine-protein kinase At3g47570 [Nicotiana attenuata]|uniref:non-specific serine/threonine protein kinase n=1 Tax=Nicotiana attenuata TaxID=49451 RepID=A0A314KW46_NICAT|nr:PREDICTED: probable LRR receptor-like serine/threonine-protein kinase At3g47570 [Nicotiana attenuata]OIT32884.1 putative lrr receptor-like serinethreonine-protein kinase [Nicotiana attenuata]
MLLHSHMDSALFSSYHSVTSKFSLVFFITSFLCISVALCHGNDTDQQALLAFRRAIKDPFGYMKPWNVSTNFCQWPGITCGRKHMRVVQLNLANQNLDGPLSPFIGNMSFLRSLYLSNNSFRGEIPSEIGRLRRLQRLNLGNNTFHGDIPSNLSRCSNLVSLLLGGNKLVGSLPPELGSLSKLEYLLLTRNNLTGEIPSSFGNLTSLKGFYAPLNNLHGKIPDSLGQLKNLKFLGIAANNLIGTIPYAIFNISSMTTFDVGINQIQGTLPSSLGITLPNLELFIIGGNNISGLIPSSLSNSSKLVYFLAGGNQLTGSVPSLENLNELQQLTIPGNYLGTGEPNDLSFISSLTNASSFRILEMQFNSFGGILPVSFRNLSTELQVVQLSYNKIRGNIPAEIGNFINLEEFQVRENLLTGTIPTSFGKVKKMQILDLSQNRFSGNIPSSLGNLSVVTILLFHDNDLTGEIPASLGNCNNLIEIYAAQNNMLGQIPKELFTLSSLVAVDISENHLDGFIPLEAGHMRNLEYLNVSENNLTGKIPSTIGSCVRLEVLDMKGNSFQGTIPPSFSSLRGLHVLDLSRNNLSGQVPNYLEDFKFQLLNLSFNGFEGMLPNEGIFKNASAISVIGNPKLCGGVPNMHLPECDIKRSKKFGSRFILNIVMSIVFGILGLTILVILLFFFLFKKPKKGPVLSSFGESLINVSYQNLLQATNGFSEDNLIGAGSYGSVYKGTLDGGIVVAVKVLNLSRHGASKSFMAECDVLRNIRHRNLVKVLTACSGIDYQGNDFKALVYEFMANGSLEDWLHLNPSEDANLAESKKLNILQRLNIAIDVASAIDYLHHHCETPIIHCDLKPSNILLDDRLVGHIGDFGLAKFLQPTAQNSSVSEGSSSLIRGTIGYTAPEYGMGSELSTCGDVYSFGILLLEMFIGKRPTDGMFSDGLDLPSFAKYALLNGATEVIEPSLISGSNEEDGGQNTSMHQNEECLVSILQVGVACSAYSGAERMNITETVSKLYSIRDAAM